MSHAKIELSEKDIKRFWDKVNKKSNDECWEWQASKNRIGYGTISIKHKARLAHRVSWAVCNGQICEGLCVCHTCDNPGCVNPAHLFLGTMKDNVRDRDRKGRGVNLVGEKHGCHKLTEKQVIEIREKYIQHKYNSTMLSKEYSVTKNMIHLIVTYKNWKHVGTISNPSEASE